MTPRPFRFAFLPFLAASILCAAEISNDYLAVSMNDDGDFTIGTTGGHPNSGSDQNAKLIYGHPYPGTSDTFVRVDGVNTQLSSATVSAAVSGDGASLQIAHTVSGIQIEQSLSLQRPNYSPRADGVLIRWILTNTTGASHTVALRTQIDTMLGSNDGSPFRLLEGGFGSITTETEFDSDGVSPAPPVPTGSIVFDDLTSPTVVALLSFLNSGYRDPDRVVFGYWGTSRGAFDYTVTPGNDITGDTSVIVYWGYPTNTITLAAGQSVQLALFYGVTNFYIFNELGLTVGAYVPEQLTAVPSAGSYAFAPDPFLVTAFFKNNLGSDISGAQIGVRLPGDLSLGVGETQWKPIEDSLGSGTTVAGSSVPQTSWQLMTLGRHAGLRRFALELSSAGENKVLAPLSVFVRGMANAVYGQLTDDAGAGLAGATLRLYQGETLVATTVSQADGTYLFSNVPAGRYTVHAVRAGQPDIVFSAESNDDPDMALTSNPVQFSAAQEPMKTFSFPNPVRDGPARISFYLDQAGSSTVQVYTPSGELLKTIDSPGLAAGWQQVAWNVDDAANGVYFYVVESGGRKARGKIAVVKWEKR